MIPFGVYLTATYGRPARPRLLRSTSRSRVWRAHLPDGPVIIKQHTRASDGHDAYQREVLALTALAQANPPVTPRLLGTDPAARLLLLEDVPRRHRPCDEWIVGWAAALARLHAGYRSLPAPLRDWTPPHAGLDALTELARHLGVPAPDGLEQEAQTLLGRLKQTPAALLHGDPCPDNYLPTVGGGRFIDLDQAARGPGALELAYLRTGWPTCWCTPRIPPAILLEAESAYNDVWLSTTGTSPAAMADACAAWLLRVEVLAQRRRPGRAALKRLLASNPRWGTATARGRLQARLRPVMAQHELPAIRRFATDLHAALGRR